MTKIRETKFLTVLEMEVGRQVSNHEGRHRVQPLRLPDASVNHGEAFVGGRGAMDVAVGVSGGERFTSYLQSRRQLKTDVEKNITVLRRE